MEEGKAEDVINLGITEAFDTVFHSILPEKLAASDLDSSLGKKLAGWLVSEDGRGWS